MRKAKRAIMIGLVIIIAAIILYYYWISRCLTMETYSIKGEFPQIVRVVHLSDLHNQEYGNSNEQLIKLIKDASPDLVVMTGDMINSDDEDIGVVVNLISKVSDFAPVYYGYGNHEVAWEKSFDRDLEEMFSAAGAVVVNNDYMDTEINGLNIRLGGYMGYYRQPHMLTQDKEQKKLELAFADDFENTDRFKILLNHIPTAWLDWGYIDKYPVDLVLSGHYHGGVIQIPVINRGLYAPYIGFLPLYTRGMYTGELATCVLSAGLGSEYAVPRINNPPEIVVIDLVPEK